MKKIYKKIGETAQCDFSSINRSLRGCEYVWEVIINQFLIQKNSHDKLIVLMIF